MAKPTNRAHSPWQLSLAFGLAAACYAVHLILSNIPTNRVFAACWATIAIGSWVDAVTTMLRERSQLSIRDLLILTAVVAVVCSGGHYFGTAIVGWVVASLFVLTISVRSLTEYGEEDNRRRFVDHYLYLLLLVLAAIFVIVGVIMLGLTSDGRIAR